MESDSATGQTGQTRDPDLALAEAVLAIGASDFVMRACDWLRANVPFGGEFVTELHGRKPPLHVHDNVRSERRPEVVDSYLDRAYLLDPFFDSYLRDDSTRVMRLADVAPDRFLGSTYYKIYYRGLRLQDELGIFVRLDAGRVLFYSLGRREGERRFTRAEVARFRHALPVFAALNTQHFLRAGRAEAISAAGRDIDSALSEFGRGLLTPREQEIAGLILKGHSSNSIAEMTGTSVGTVKSHRKNLYRKMQISSQAELFHAFLDAAFD